MKVTIREGYEYRPIKEKIGEKETRESLLYESYCRALSIVEKYEETLEFDSKKKKPLADDGRPREKSAVKNILVLSSQRGQGKSSALYSLCEYLVDNNCRKPVYKISNPNENYIIKRKYYRVNDVIDPSSMREGESIIKVVLSRLFVDFSRRVTNDCVKIDSHLRREITDLFQKCYRCVDVLMGNAMSNNIYDQESLEALSELGDSGNLKKSLKELVDKFLKMAFNEECRANTLLIPIDDTDLAIGGAFNVCEDIRNYLSTDNILVVMAADMDQLENAIEQKYICQYELLIRNKLDSAEKRVYLDKCREMATRYVEKIFPRGYRVELNKVEDAFKSVDKLKLSYVDFDEKEKTFFSNDFDYADQLAKALYDRTGMIFIKNKDKECPFFPSTLRELNHFARMLDEMEIVDENKLYIYDDNKLTEESLQEIDKILRNIKGVKNYYVNNWAPLHTSEIVQKEIEVLAALPLSQFKNSVIDTIEEVTGAKVGSGNPLYPDIRSFRMAIDSQFEKLKKSNAHSDLERAIQILYTINLNEYYFLCLKKGKTDDMADILTGAFDVVKDSGGAFNWFSYDIEKEWFVKRFVQHGKIASDAVQWIMEYCDLSDKNNGNLNPKFIESNGSLDYKLINRIHVDYFGYFMNMLLYPRTVSSSVNISTMEKYTDTSDATVSIPVNKPKAGDITANKVIISVIRNFMLNYDAHQMFCDACSDALSGISTDLGLNYEVETTKQMVAGISEGYFSKIPFIEQEIAWIGDMLGDSAYDKDFLLLNKMYRNTITEKLWKDITASIEDYISKLEAAKDIDAIRQLASEKIFADSYTENETVLSLSAEKIDDELNVVVSAASEAKRAVEQMFKKISARSDKAVASALRDKKTLMNQLTEICGRLRDDRTDFS